MLTLKDSLDVVSLDSETDYRRLAAAQAPLAPLPPTTTPAEAEVAAQGLPGSASYFFPLGLTADAAMERQWRSATGGRGAGTAGSAELPVLFGRTLHVVSRPLHCAAACMGSA